MRLGQLVSVRPQTLLVFSAILVFIFWTSAGEAQDKAGDGAAKPPSITEVQRLQLVTVALRLENAQLKAQAAQRDFDQALQERTALVASLQVQGFVFDPGTLTYRPAESAGK